jgi:FkbM family methyltransferase
MVKAAFRSIRAITPIKLRRFFYKAGLFLGASLYPSYPSIDGALKYLKEWGFEPTSAIDVGAYNGEWARMFKSIFPSSKVLMIEGQNDKSQILQEVCSFLKSDVVFEITLLGAKDGEKVRFVEMETGSSVFEEFSPYKRNYLEKELVTLDSLLARYQDFRNLDFLKLDVQGYELEVLKGASELLKRTEFVLMEASLIPSNNGCPLLSDVINFMSEKNFRLLDFCSQIRRRDGALWQTDLLFIKNTSKFMPRASLDARNWYPST